jgi:hypothetical protein
MVVLVVVMVAGPMHYMVQEFLVKETEVVLHLQHQ